MTTPSELEVSLLNGRLARISAKGASAVREARIVIWAFATAVVILATGLIFLAATHTHFVSKLWDGGVISKLFSSVGS